MLCAALSFALTNFSYDLLLIRLKLHEDWGTTPAAIDCALTAAEKHDVQVYDFFIWMLQRKPRKLVCS